MDVLFLMDPLERVNPTTDTTYALIAAARVRGHSTWFARFEELWLDGGVPGVLARRVEVPGASTPFEWRGSPTVRDVATFPVVFVRTDPPFDEAYLETTWILDRLDRARTLVVNDPTGIRGAGEKLWAQRFPELGPRTLVTSDRARLRAFVEEHGEAVLKPVEMYGGEGIVFASAAMRGLSALIDAATAGGKKRIVAQPYLAAASEGDKRILVLDGEPLGAILRVHGAGEERNNLHLGGTARKSSVDAADRKILATLAPALREHGLWFVGIDVIGGKLTEVNVTSPTGIQELGRLDGFDPAGRVIEWVERRAPAN